jgi:acetyl-CoA C-acetyltransferase/acetyl-CoA acyltransferase
MVDEVIFGCVCQPVDSANVTRIIALRSGIPIETPAYTVHRNCASGLEAITQAYDKVNSGAGDIFIVGGTESMSNVPFLFRSSAVNKFAQLSRSKSVLAKLRTFSSFRLRDFSPIIGLKLGLTDPYSALNMGETAELLSNDFAISREEQDTFSLSSHLKASQAIDKLREEITPFYFNTAIKGRYFSDRDNGPRDKQTMEALAKLRPVFDYKDGTVTAGNASQITDGAVAILVASEEAVNRLGLNPIGKLTAYAFSGCNPSRMGIGPVHAMNDLEKRTSLRLKDADIIEINEAFAAQVIACKRAAASEEYCKRYLGRNDILGEIPDKILNVNGGAIALGHPVGATGARLVLSSLYELRRRNAKRALVSLCIGGGQGGAAWLEAA